MAWYIRLRKVEEMALCRLADRERRRPKDQVAVLLREALITAGALLPDDTLPHDSHYDRDAPVVR